VRSYKSASDHAEALYCFIAQVHLEGWMVIGKWVMEDGGPWTVDGNWFMGHGGWKEVKRKEREILRSVIGGVGKPSPSISVGTPPPRTAA